MLDAQVPQTTAIERSKAKLEVKYDGDPQFKKIEGTKVEYAVNTQSQALRIESKYSDIQITKVQGHLRFAPLLALRISFVPAPVGAEGRPGSSVCLRQISEDIPAEHRRRAPARRPTARP